MTQLPVLPKEFEVFAEDVPHSIIHGVTLETMAAEAALEQEPELAPQP